MERDEHSSSVAAAEGGSEPGDSRRGLLSKGVKLAAAIPAVLALAQGSVAYAAHGPPNWAADDPGDDQDQEDPGPGNRGRGRGRGQGPPFGRPFRAQDLCSVKQVGSADFGAAGSSPGSDSLTAGEVRVFRAAGTSTSLRVWVRLVGAAVSTPYTVAFVRFNDHGRESLGTITTGASGNFAGFTPTMLSGTVRVGVFVLINNNNGSDQFVSCVP